MVFHFTLSLIINFTHFFINICGVIDLSSIAKAFNFGFIVITNWPSISSLEPLRQCIRLANPRNGQIRNLVSDNIYLPGHEILFECDDRYKLIGTPILTCMENGNWSHPAPSCIRKYSKLTCL